jgi:Ca2+-binding RTX toxin-like protein
MRRLVPFVLLFPVLLVPSGPASGAEGAVARCQGIRATIVGTPGEGRIHGTPGPDVIVTNGVRYVSALKGNDRICITKRGSAVLAGGGHDVVKVVVADYRQSVAILGSGRDVFIGGGHQDEVWGNDNGRDVIRTGAGNDHVIAGGAEGMEDRVLLGAGKDTFDFRSDRTIGDGRISGGPGTDQLRGEKEMLGEDVVIDASTGVGTRDGEPFLSFAGMESYTLDYDHETWVTFIGSDRDEYVYMQFATISGDLGGGDDTIVGDLGPAGTEEEFSGGAGVDSVVLEGSVVTFDATAGTAVGGPNDGTAVYDGFEWFHGIGRSVVMNGSEAGETLVAFGCDVVIHGLGGADTLTSYASHAAVDDFGCDDTSSELFGDAGDDVMTGANRTDMLIGGDGNDSADGGKGEDICQAETKVNCES